MTAMDLLDSLGGVRSDYVMAAQRYREGQKAGHRRSPLKIFLIAAAIVALLTGCAVAYVLHLENMKMGTEVFADIDDTQPKAHTALSMQGVVGSSNYNAAKEWYEFCQSYEQDYNTMVPLTEEEEEIYSAYFCYDRQMADKLEEITQKYAQYYFDWLEMNRYAQEQWEGDPSVFEYDPYYTIRDINGDGEAELLIYKGDSIDEVVTMIDGVTYNISPKPGMEGSLELCENDIFVLRFISVDGPEACNIFRFKGDRKQPLKYMSRKEDGWYDCPSMNPISDEAYDTKLTDEQFEEIQSAYPRVDLGSLNLRPLKELAAEGGHT